MKNPAKSNIYEANALSVLEAYESYVEGSPEDVMVIVAAEAQTAEARSAITNSATRLGYGSAVAWVNLNGRNTGEHTGEDTGEHVEGNTGKDTGEDAGKGIEGQTEGDTGRNADTGASLGARELMGLIEGLDPVVLVALDAASAALLAEAYRCELQPDSFAHVFGRPTVAFGNFCTMLNTDEGKQRAWRLLKRLST